LLGELNGFSEANYKKAPTGTPYVSGDSLSYALGVNDNAEVALVAEFIDAKCYYGVRFADPNAIPKTGVKRNHYYEYTITEFKGVGKESMEDVNKPPTNPVEEGDTYVTATLKIEPWRSVTGTVVPDDF
jgi:hypothetical protein